ncbi:MAG: branched-chain amino acid ABC transporter permease [Desulfobacterales bacterium]|nr:branched-chain amino acid ABC transporter permease [Desulfobacterales bacterium]
MQGRDIAGLMALIAAVIAAPLTIGNDYYLGVLIFAAFNCLTCIGLCLLMGYAGQISLGHGAFVAIGAYAAGIFTTSLGWSPWIAIFAGVFIVAAVSAVVGIPTLRLKGHYLAMATLGFASIVHILAVATVEVTGGPSGLLNIPRMSVFGYELDSDLKYFYFSWAVVVIGLYLAFNLINSRIGRSLRALHGSEDAAASLGVNITACKIQVFVLSAVYASISGSLYAYYVNYIDPGPFGVMHSVLLVTMVAVGGMHKIWGAFTGAMLLSLLPEVLSFSTNYLKVIGIAYQPDYDILVYGGILLLIMLFLPEGVFEGLSRAARAGRQLVRR